MSVTRYATGDSTPLGGGFSLGYGASRTPYLPHSVTATDLASALSALPNLGRVSVSRSDATPDGGYQWLVTFAGDLGDVPSLTADALTLTGTAPGVAVSEVVKGVLPPFNSGAGGLPLGTAVVTDLDALSYTASGLAQGVPPRRLCLGRGWPRTGGITCLTRVGLARF